MTVIRHTYEQTGWGLHKPQFRLPEGVVGAEAGDTGPYYRQVDWINWRFRWYPPVSDAGRGDRTNMTAKQRLRERHQRRVEERIAAGRQFSEYERVNFEMAKPPGYWCSPLDWFWRKGPMAGPVVIDELPGFIEAAQ